MFPAGYSTTVIKIRQHNGVASWGSPLYHVLIPHTFLIMQPVRIVNLDKLIFTAPDGRDVIFRYALEELVPTHIVDQLETYLRRHPSYAYLPIAFHEKMYMAHDADVVAAFFYHHIGNDFTFITRHIHEETTTPDTDDATSQTSDEVSREDGTGDMGTPAPATTVSDMLEQGEVSSRAV